MSRIRWTAEAPFYAPPAIPGPASNAKSTARKLRHWTDDLPNDPPGWLTNDSINVRKAIERTYATRGRKPMNAAILRSTHTTVLRYPKRGFLRRALALSVREKDVQTIEIEHFAKHPNPFHLDMFGPVNKALAGSPTWLDAARHTVET